MCVDLEWIGKGKAKSTHKNTLKPTGVVFQSIKFFYCAKRIPTNHKPHAWSKCWMCSKRKRNTENYRKNTCPFCRTTGKKDHIIFKRFFIFVLINLKEDKVNANNQNQTNTTHNAHTSCLLRTLFDLQQYSEVHSIHFAAKQMECLFGSFWFVFHV